MTHMSPDIADQPPPKPRAQRLDKKAWEEHQQKIIDLYLSTDLDNVMRTMSRDYGFRANKRQYVFQLGKWKVKKYGKNGGAPKSASGRKQSRDEVPRADLVSEPGVLEQLYPLVPGISSSLGREETSELCVLKGDFCSGVSDDDWAFKLYLELEEKLQKVPHLAKERLLISRARAAETRENAQGVIRSIHTAMAAALASQEGPSTPSFTVALYKILLGYVYDRSNMEGSGESSEKQQAVSFVTEGMSQLVDADYKLRTGPTKHKVFDMVTYMLLNYGLDVHISSYAPGADPKALPEDFKFSILRDFVDQQGLRERVMRKPPRTILRDCLKWCVEKLEFSSAHHLSRHLSELLSMDCRPCFILWKADIFIYCFLWYKWYQDYAEGNVAPWSQNSMIQLGISFSDLLVTVVWMFMHPEQDASRKKQARQGNTPEKQAPKPPDDHAEPKLETKTEPGEQKPTTKLEEPGRVKAESSPGPAMAAPDPEFVEKARFPKTLIPLAKERAVELTKAKENDLWAQALDEFTWLNSHTDLPKEEKEFNQNVFARTRQFIDELVMHGPKRDASLPSGIFRHGELARGSRGSGADNEVPIRLRGRDGYRNQKYTNGVGEGSDDGDDDGVEEDEEEGEDSGDPMEMDGEDANMKDPTEPDVELD